MTNAMFVLNKADLAKRISEEMGLSQAKANDVIVEVFHSIQEDLAKGNAVNITGFGKFEVRTRASRTGVNPSTGEKIHLPEMKTPAFRAGKQLKDAVK